MKKRKKILYIITKSIWGGAQRYVFDLATNIPQDDFDIAVACGPTGKLIERLEQAHIRTIILPSLGRDIHIAREVRSFFSILKILIRERPDIVHLNSSKAGGLGAVATRIASLVAGHEVLVIYTVHGWAFLEDRSRLWRTIVFIGSWLSTLFQDAIIVINRKDFEHAERFVPHSKLVLVPNGIGSIQFNKRPDARMFLSEAVHSSITKDELLIGTIAELTPTKGLTYLLDAVEILKHNSRASPFSLIIIGGGENYHRLENEIRRKALQDYVFLAGRIYRAAQYLTAFDIFVLPSLKEGLPYAVLEAMRAGIPIVASAVGGIPDLLNQGAGRMVEPKNSKALAKILLELMHDAKQREELGRRAEEASQKFSLERMIQETVRAYRVT